jgi:hypothetical protein
MKPVSPVAIDPEKRWGVSEIDFAKDQPQYLPLPALRFSDGLVVSRWTFSMRERFKILLGGSVYLGQLTFNTPLRPVRLSTSVEEVVGTDPEE